ncbi:MAG: PaaI family thioesterase [Actinomycetota bacterium]|nr:PaaI family thioesterase [Actinomycetota bacterium]
MPPERMQFWSRFGKWDTVWYRKFLGIEVEEIRLDYARMRLPYRPEFRQPAGVVHGRVIASMIDTVVVPAVGGGYEEPRQLFTIDIQLRFLAPIVDDDLVAEGWITQRGRQIVFCDAEVRSGAGVLAATGTLTYKVSSKPLTM